MDTRYLKQRGQVWWFQLAVPADLRPRFGRVLQKSLGTSELSAARVRRDELLGDWRAKFRRARQGELTAAEVEAERSRELQATWRWLAAKPSDGVLEDYHADLTDPETGETELDELRPRARAILERIGAPVDEGALVVMTEALLDAQTVAGDHLRYRLGPPPAAPVAGAARGSPRLPLSTWRSALAVA